MRIGRLLILVAVVAACAWPLSASAAGPSISFGSLMIDLGAVPSGKRIQVTFPFVNAGDSELIVQDVRPDCHCTEISEGARDVPPRGNSAIVAILDTTGAPGKKESHIMVRSNDPQKPVVTLRLLVDVTAEQ